MITLKPGDIQKLLNAPGATCNVTTVPGPPASVTLAGKSALKVYKVKEVDSVEHHFQCHLQLCL